MNIFSALFKHATLAFSLKHDGTGMPSELNSALTLYITYLCCHLYANTPNLPATNEILALVFIGCCYIHYLRNEIIGLILLISILSNLLHILFNQILLLDIHSSIVILEYIMIFAAMINIIKLKAHPYK